MKKIIAVALALLMSFSCFSLISFAEGTETTEHLTEVPEGYVGVYTIEDLYCVRNDLTANYILMNDIDLTEALADGGVWNTGTGWQPIGESSSGSQAFTGTFDGNNYSLIGLRFYGTAKYDYTGLFGCNEGVIKDLNLTDFIVTDSLKYFGLICASNSGEVKNIKANGTINAVFDIGGGICGTNSGVISDCHFDAESTVSRSDDFCYGNICGENHVDAFIRNCSSRGTDNITSNGKYGKSQPTITSYTYAGGIAGKNAGTIEYSFNKSVFDAKATASFSWGKSTSNLSGTTISYYFSNSNSTIGGIAATNTGTINNCYNTGSISIVGSYSYESGTTYDARKPTTSIGGIAGVNTLGNIGYCYNFSTIEYSGSFSSASKGALSASGNSTETSYYLSTSTSNSGTSLTETMFGVRGCFSNLDFENTWFIDASTGVERPQLINNPEVIHKHNYTSEITIPATHLTEGVKTSTCECGDTYTEAIAKLEGHTYTSEVTKEATHLAEGETTYTCACGDSYTEAIAKLTGHTYEKVVTAPTCTANGYTTYTCACGDSYVDNYTDELDHEYTSEVTTEPTHLTEGVKTFTCKCGDTYTEPVAKLEGHTYTTEVTKEPTHLEEGVKTFTCECGDSYTEVIDKTVEHTYKVITIEPECTEKGYKIYVCNCGDSYTETLPKNGHTKSDWIIDKDSTCSEEGSKHIECTVCEEIIETEAIAKIPHSYTSVVTDATCEKAGYTTYTCDCGREYISDKTPSKGHNYIDGLCKDCGESKVDNCSCNCHKGGISGFFFKIINFFQKLFGMNKTCACGASH